MNSNCSFRRGDIEKILVGSLVDASRLRSVLSCDKVMFLLHEKSPLNVGLTEIWLNQLRANNRYINMKHVVVYIDDTEDRTKQNLVECGIKQYEDEFQWWPCVLKALFGRTNVSTERPTILDISVDKTFSKAYIGDVNEMLKYFGVDITKKASERRIILISDQEVPAEESVKLRASKLAGCSIHTFLKNRWANERGLRWISNWQHSTKNVYSFFLMLLIDMQLVDIKRELIEIAKVPAYPIKTPVMFEKCSQDALRLVWSMTGDSNSRVLIKQRSETSNEWKINDKLYGPSSMYLARNLCQNKKYQFCFTVESTDETSEPVMSDWVSIEAMKNKMVTLKKTCLAFLLIFVALLNLVQALLILVIILGIAALPIALVYFTGNSKLLEKSGTLVPLLIKEKSTVLLCIHCLFLAVYLGTAWMITSNQELFIVLYIFPPSYLLFWSIIANTVCMVQFGFKSGVFTMYSELRDCFATANIKLHQYKSDVMV